MSKANIIVLKPYQTQWPLNSGGQLRSLHLYAHFDTDIPPVTFVEPTKEIRVESPHKGFATNYWRTPWYTSLLEILTAFANKRRADNLFVVDILSTYAKQYQSILRGILTPDTILCVEHCYMFTAALSLPRKSLIYSAHNVEYDLKRAITPKSLIGTYLIRHTFKREKELCQLADRIVACTQADKERFVELYTISPDKISVIPNGFDSTTTKPQTPESKKKLKQLVQTKNPIALFFGSLFPPNVKAVRYIVNVVSKKMPGVHFVIAGSAGSAIRHDKKTSANIFLKSSAPALGKGFLPLGYWLNRLGRFTESTFELHSQGEIQGVRILCASIIPSILTIYSGKKMWRFLVFPIPRKIVIPINTTDQAVQGTVFPSTPTASFRRLGIAIQRLEFRYNTEWRKINVAQIAPLEHSPAKNVTIIEEFDDTQKNFLLGVSDIAINPVTEGSGSNIKMFEYIAAELPIISTPAGARGFSNPAAHGITVSSLEYFDSAIQKVLSGKEGYTNRERLSIQSWEQISKMYASIIEGLGA